MKRTKSSKPSVSSRRAQSKRKAASGDLRIKRRNEIRVAWVTGVLAVVLAIGSVLHFLNSPGPPYQGRGAASAAGLYEKFGPIGPALPWLVIAGILAFISLAAARGWGDDVQ
ncbi:MAG: hypothetical protein JNJ55_06885 [Betaproteobacteria bacterium]|nr:hypothetical protein [Betaproteobacteria bacterium]